MALEDLVDEETLKKMKGKAFGINPASRYNDNEFLTRAKELFTLDEHYQTLSKNSGDLDALKSIGSMAINYMAGDPNENAQMMRDPYIASQQAETLLGTGKNKMASFIGNNLDKIIEKLSPETIRGLATQYALPKKLKEIAEARKEGNVAILRKIYIEERGKDGILVGGALGAPDSKIIEWMDRIYSIESTNVVINNFTKKKENDKYEFDVEKARKYISGTISKLDDKIRAGAYLELGQYYYAQQSRGKK